MKTVTEQTGIRPGILAVAYAAEAQVAATRNTRRTNGQRAVEGMIACSLLAAMTGLEGEDAETVIGDTLTQILHYAHSAGLDVDAEFEHAKFNLECELAEDPA